MHLVGTLVERGRVDDTSVDAIIWFSGTAESLRNIGRIPSLTDCVNEMIAMLAMDHVFAEFELAKYANIIVQDQEDNAVRLVQGTIDNEFESNTLVIRAQ